MTLHLRQFVASVVLVAALGAAPMARAEGCEPSLDRAAQLPASCNLVIAIDEARSLRSTEAGLRLVEILLDTPAAPALAEGWEALAEELGVGPERAFDDLLGENVMVVFRGDPPESGQWALWTRVSEGTQRRVVEALRPGTREIVGGLPILSMERGQFLMAMRTQRGSKGSGEMVFAPAASRELFDDMCGFIARAPRAAVLADTPVFAEARSLPAGPVLLLRRGRDVEFALTARPDDAAWAAAFAAHRIGAPRSEPTRAAWTPPDFGSLGPATGLAMVGDAALLRRAALLLAPVAEPDAPEPDGSGRLGALWMVGSAGADSAFPSVTWAAETKDLAAGAAGLDQRMAEALQAMAGGANLRGPDFGGRALGVVRSAALDPSTGSLAWAAVRGAEPDSGWLVIHRGPSGVRAGLAVRRLAGVLAEVRAEPGPARAARLVGVVRPALLSDWALTPEVSGPLTARAARGIQDIRWDVSDAGDRLAGAARVRLAPVRLGPERPGR